ncbi:MAG: large conductance mechanosensitive channel protein MscL [Candidatus Magasanikbacteria bacterium CG11_big_fil_rev_8_21_14_0_20_43_7]|uniref:Large-conductance mechanosensitive channel n=1 Tax=Candidatus Magasanikbacteria bacterium CG11_big_fil_rev_8_21_14_0_20_43_7 TaxID=1974654 RepID=A0A2H0N2E6_9BACT|nr:MAG: large conductance mechanosensitive channel protein MscL [Candidatus Magasanikbacteria bacterium CG11_big_fil_rev_8_21_14_0_20_43_7]
MKTFLEEFKKFAMRGNVMDMAIGVVIGSAFGKIVTSLVNDILMPPIGRLLGGADFKDLFFSLSGGSYDNLAAAQEAGATTLNYGIFINTLLDFLIIALAIFIFIRQINKFKKKEDVKLTPPQKPSPEEVLLTEIRDLLRK